MRLLVLSNLYPPSSYGGYELICRDVVDRLAQRGHQAFVLTSGHELSPEPGAEPVAPADSAAVERTLPLTWDHGQPPARWRRPAIERRAQRMLAGAIARHRPDVISVWNPSGLPGSLLPTLANLDLPVVWILGDSWPERVTEGDPWLAPFANRPRLARLVATTVRLPTTLPDLGQAGVLCFNSAYLRDRVGAVTGWSMAGAVVSQHGVDLNDFPLTEPATNKPWSWRLLFVGRLDTRKGIDTLIRSLPHLPPEASLEVIGPTEAAHVTRIKALVASLGLGGRVTIGSVPRNRLAAIYRSADVCVFPSEWDEPFGIVPLESMASGTPVAATGTGGSGEYLADGQNCLRFAAGDGAALVSAIRRMAGDPILRARVIMGGRATAARLTVERLTDDLEEIHGSAATRQ